MADHVPESTIFDAGSERDPASIAFAQLAEEYRRAGQLDERSQTCRTGLAIHPEYLSRTRHARPRVLASGHLQEASAELSRSWRPHPNNLAADPRARGDLSPAGTRLRRPHALSSRALDLAPNDPISIGFVARISPTRCHRRANAFRRRPRSAPPPRWPRSNAGWRPSMPHAPSAALSRRHAAVRQSMRDQALDALIVISLPEHRLAHQLHGQQRRSSSSRPTRCHFITDSRYVTAVSDSAGRRTNARGSNWWWWMGRTTRRWRGVFDQRAVPPRGLRGGAPDREPLQLAGPLRWGTSRPNSWPTDGIVEIARSVKDAYELGVLQNRRHDAVRRHSLVCSVWPVRGMTERELALAIDAHIRRAGFERTGLRDDRRVRTERGACRTRGPRSEN